MTKLLSTDYIDLNDYTEFLTHHKKKGFYECPLCNGKLGISRGNGKKFTCYGSGCDRSDIRKAVLPASGEDTRYSQEFLDKREAREQARVEAERERLAKLQTEEERDRDWRGIIGNSFLSERHRQDMLDRGWTPEQITLSNARSSAEGRIIPITTATGEIVGSQVITPEGKRWYGSEGTNHLRETGELPLAVVYPAAPRAGIIAYTESTLDKPHLTAHRLSLVTIGSSNIGSQPNDLKRSIATIKERQGWDTVTHVLMADGGAVANKGVMANYRKLSDQLEALGERLVIGWWGQLTKTDGDIDEIDPATEIEYLSPDRFWQIAKDQNGLLDRFFRQFRPKRERVKPQPVAKEATAATEYNTPKDHRQLLQNAIKTGVKAVLDITHAGGFKSTTAAQIDGLEGIDKYLYLTAGHRNPTTIEVENSFDDYPSRHSGLFVNPDRTTPSGKPYLQTSQPQGANWQQVAGNCHQAELHHTLANKGHDLNGDDNPICRVCPQLNACHHAIGNGYGYKHAKHAAIDKPRLRIHPQSLPHPDYLDYSSSVLIWDDEKVKTQQLIDATDTDFNNTLATLAIESPELLPSISPIIAKLKPLFNGQIKAYHGLSHNQILEGIGEIDPAVLHSIASVLTPDFEELVQECDGIDTTGMTAKDKRAVKSADRIMAQTSKRDNRDRLNNLPSNWLVALLEVIINGEGYVRFDGRKLIITQPDRYHQQIVQTAKLSLFLDATGSREELARTLGLLPDEVMVITKPQPIYPNLQITQVMGLGTPRKDRSASLVTRLSALTAAIAPKHKNVGVIDWVRDEGKGLWFADSRGTNRYKDCDALVLIGSPCPNLGAMAAEFSILYNRQIDPTSEDAEYRLFVASRIEAEIVQAIARLRAHLSPEEQKTIYLVADREDIPLDRILGHYPDCQFDRVEAIDIAIESATPTQQLRHKLTTYLLQKKFATQQELAKAIECSQSRISQLFSQFNGGWRKLLLTLYSSLNRVSNNYHTSPSLLINWEKYLDADVVKYVEDGILQNQDLTDDDRASLVVDLAVRLTSREFEVLTIGLGKELSKKLVNLLEIGVARIAIEDGGLLAVAA